MPSSAWRSRRRCPGRLEAVPAKRQFQIFVDYAHTDDALLNVLKTLRELAPRKLICRLRRRRRSRSGKSARSWAGWRIRTPTTASSPPIIRGKKIPPRSSRKLKRVFAPRTTKRFRTAPKAIARAIALAQPRDIVLIAGKGHETYQEFGDHTVPFDDLQMAQRRSKIARWNFRIDGSAFARFSSRAVRRRRPPKRPWRTGSSPRTDVTRLDSRHAAARRSLRGCCAAIISTATNLSARRLERGAAGAMVEKTGPENRAPDFSLLRVPDTLAAYQQIAAQYRRSLGLKVVAITGSNGKTSTKDFTASVLARAFSGHEDRRQFQQSRRPAADHAARDRERRSRGLGNRHESSRAKSPPLAELAAPGHRDHHQRRPRAYRIHGYPAKRSRRRKATSPPRVGPNGTSF